MAYKRRKRPFSKRQFKTIAKLVRRVSRRRRSRRSRRYYR